MSNHLLKGLLITLFCVFLGMLLFHPSESTGWASPFQEGSTGTLRVDVDLVTVEVIAQDKKGKPILGLKREDFRLYDDGKLQPIVTFDVVADSGDKSVPTSLNDIDESKRGKVVLILFDDSNIMPQQIKLSRDTAATYVKQHMRPWDLFAVADYGLSLKITQTFTHDGAKVIEAIQLPAMSHANQQDLMQTQLNSNQDPSMAAGRRGRTGRQDPLGQASGTTAEVKYRSAVFLRSLGSLSTSIARIKGRKIVLLFSEDFKLSTDLQNELQHLITVSQRSNVAYYTIDARGLNAPSPIGFGPQGFLPRQKLETRSQVNHQLWSGRGLVRLLFPAIDLLKPDPAALMAANFFQARGGGQGGGQGGGSQPGGQGGGGQTGGGSQGGSTGGGSNAPGQNSGQPGSGTTNQQGNFPPSGPGSLTSLNEFQQSYMENILRSLADSTGGTSVFNTNNLNQGLDKVDLELSNYYVLGFNPSSPKRDGKLRKIEVKTEAKGTKLKYRTGYVDPRPPDALAGSKGERSLLSAISSPTAITQLPVMFRSVYFYDASSLVRVPITASIQHGAIELKKKGPLLVNSVDVMGVAYGEDGSVAARFSETLNLSVEKDKEEAFRNQDIPYQNYLKLRPGKYQLKMAIADEKGKIGTSEQPLVIPPLPADGMASSSLVITQQMTQLPELIRNIQSKLMEENDPLSYKGMQLTPDVDHIVSKEGNIAVYYKVYNLKNSGQNRHLVAKIQVTDEKGAPATNVSLSLDDAAQSTGSSEAAIGFTIPLKDLAPGKYQLTVMTQDTEQNQSVTSATEFTIR